MRRRLLALVLLTPALAAGSNLLASPPPPLLAPPISGVVRSVEVPVSGALVILYNLADASLTRARTAADGTFVVAAAPVGIYDLIAYKKGFAPALVRLWHQAAPQQVSSISIELASTGKSAKRGATPPDIWELRDRLPSDILREITAGDTEEREAASPAEKAQHRFTRIDGDVQTVTDVARTESSLARAAVGVRGGLPNGWAYSLQGDYSSVSDQHNTPPPDGTALGSAAGLALDVSPSALDHVRVTTRRNQLNFGDQGPGSLQAHQVAWDRDGGEGALQSVAARYVDESGVYSATAPGTTLFPAASRTLELQGAYGRPPTDSPGVSVAMTYRRREGGPSGAATQAAPDADLSAGASLRLGSWARVEGGVVARYLSGGYGLAPRAEARVELSDGSVLFVRGLYRVIETGAASGVVVMPRVASVQDSNDPASRISLAAGIQHRETGATYTLQVSQQQMDEAVRAFFDGDMLTEFDSVYLMGGNTVRRVDGTAQHRLTNTLAGNVTAGYGTIDGAVRPDNAATYGILDNRGRFWTAQAGIEVLPTKTGVAVVLHGVRQRLAMLSSSLHNDSDKLALSLSQDLSIVGVTPFGTVCRLIVALESTRSTRLSEKEDAPVNKRLLGGVAVSF